MIDTTFRTSQRGAGHALPSIRRALVRKSAAKPNILVIMGDDIGYWNISAYNRGQMGYRTRTSTGWRRKAGSSPTITASSPAPPAAPPSSPARARCAPAC